MSNMLDLDLDVISKLAVETVSLTNIDQTLKDRDAKITSLEKVLEEFSNDVITERKNICEKCKTICELEKQIQYWKGAYNKVLERNKILRRALDKRDAEIVRLRNQKKSDPLSELKEKLEKDALVEENQRLRKLLHPEVIVFL